ncbi:transglutaminase-like domain-containing protein [Aporhodopirellula aestuarii]|uniref:Transglutaminase-like domain-containing protein n=1 Tax=Aporhodopirellula aestuarii TaxID=2950107 RepID=A0ABT0UBF7_9BACT|nr:transglutaminase-like domain-containing protein [Aporhodopirellula aestuarii]MCM2374121.1 transglutaminase-like domain-containing protein [Aporhodopirellula aestuarii]
MAAASFSRRQWLAASGGTMAAALLNPNGAFAQTGSAVSDSAATENSHEPTYSESKSFDWQFGMTLRTPVTFTNGLATFPIPMDWPEQTVTIGTRDVSQQVSHLQVRDLPGGARQVVVGIARMTANSSLNVLLNYRIEKRNIIAPTDTGSLVIPTRAPREMRSYLGTSPMIDSTHTLIRSLSRQLASEAEGDESAWQTVRRIYDCVREKVAYTEGPIRNASEALKDGKGDCEDMTSLFVALCRNAQIPARMVWIPGHCYPEFYLERDGGGNDSGCWYPCQAAGTEQFGEMQEERPILQKGDRFKVPEQRQIVRYVSEFFRCDRLGKGSPRIDFVRELKS